MPSIIANSSAMDVHVQIQWKYNARQERSRSRTSGRPEGAERESWAPARRRSARRPRRYRAAARRAAVAAASRRRSHA